MQDFKILAVSDHDWGEGGTIPEALAAMRKQGKSPRYRVYVVHPETRVDADGSVRWPQGERHPVLIDERLPKGAKAS